MSNTNETRHELAPLSGDAAAMVRAFEADDGAAVSAVVAGLSSDERDGLVLALAALVPMGWRAAYRAGLEFGAEHGPADLDGQDRAEVAGMVHAELVGYLGAVIGQSRRSS